MASPGERPPLPVSCADVREALPRVHGVLRPTPLIHWPGLSEELGCELYLKHENHQPVGAFKVRGGVNLVSQLSDDERRRGILGVSTGNHGQSLAFACQRLSVPCAIVVPIGTNPDKLRAIRQLGAELIEMGADFDEARERSEQLALSRGCRYVHSANEPHLIAGVGTMGCEIIHDLPDVDAIFVPVGLGSGACGIATVIKATRPSTQVIGVQAVGAAAVTRSWRSGRWQTTDVAATWAEGFATRVPAQMTMEILRALVDDMILVDDEELEDAVFRILYHTHNLAEGAGAGALAAAYRERARWRGRKVVAVVSGGNLDLARLPRILDEAGRRVSRTQTA